MFTAGWEWRDAIKPDDRVDIFDTQGHWFLGTVIKVRETSREKEVLVGYRVYMATGTKKDQSGRRHEGWSEQYDEWIPANSIRLQRQLVLITLHGYRPNSVTKLGTVYCRKYLDNEAPAPEDSSDILLYVRKRIGMRDCRRRRVRRKREDM